MSSTGGAKCVSKLRPKEFYYGCLGVATLIGYSLLTYLLTIGYDLLK